MHDQADLEIEYSPLCDEITRDGLTVRVQIYRLKSGNEGWSLEVVDHENVSMSTLFEVSVCAFFEVGFVCVGPAPDAGEHAVVLAAVKDASRRWRGGPETGHP